MTATSRTKRRASLTSNLLEGSTLAEELRLELRATEEGVQRYKELAAKAEKRGEAASLKAVERLMAHWFAVYSAAIRKEQRAIEKNTPGIDRAKYGIYFNLVKDNKLAVIAMHEAVGMVLATDDHRGVPALQIALAIGRAVNGELNLIAVRADEDAWYELTHTDRSKLNPKHINRIANKRIEEGMRWPLAHQVSLGAMLLKLLIETASTVPYNDGAFAAAFDNTLHRDEKGRTKRWIKLHDDTKEIIAQGHAFRQYLRPKYQPMVHLPLAWSATERGGYLRLHSPLVKRLAPGKDKHEPASEVYEGVNAMTRTPWRINDKIARVMRQLYDAGGGYAGMVSADNVPKPPVPPEFDSDPEVKKKWKKEAAIIHRGNRQLDAQRVTFLHMLDRAEAFRDHDRIYFPHQLDFRGRAYPIPLYLNHHGDDLSRGLLQFADYRKPTKDARRWLAIHAANCCGVDKVNYEHRAQWTKENLSSFEGWADKPLENTGWMNTEKPWQTLAAAFALTDDEAAGRLPVQLDGTCNGLQHYAALTRDSEGAEAVNLVPGDAPSDVYTRVAKAVAAIVAQDADAGIAEAVTLEGSITRKMVKQPVMTSVYGVTAIGAKDQIQNHLADPLVKDGMSRREAYKQTYKQAAYLSNVVLKAIGNVCLGAGRMMTWLRDCARLIVEKGHVVEWTTPLGLHVEQAYRNSSIKTVRTCLGCFSVAFANDKNVPLVRRQVNGFPPNFIHSIDASHMLMSATACLKEGIAFASVHDSYWTHASDVSRMAALLREQFVKLHEQPIVRQLDQQMRERWPELAFADSPPSGDFDISQVRESDYFFS